MKRRNLLAGAASLGVAAGMGPARPAIAQTARVLRFVPQANLTNADPVWTTTVVAHNHATMVWDVLYSLDTQLQPRPQMLAGHEVSDDKLTWRMTLRDGLLFHDGEPVRAIDCAASFTRWARRDGMGQKILAQLAGMQALDDKRLEIRLTRPFPLLPFALANGSCFVMPERVAKTDPFQQITEIVGSGPYRFLSAEWVSGSKAAYARFDKYQPRDEPINYLSGGKRANFDRVEWLIMPDPATAAAALQKGEVDWIEQPLADLLPMLRKSAGVTVEAVDPFGVVGIIRFNCIQPPFDNVKLRRALLPAIDQNDFLSAIVGDDASLKRPGVGVFTLGTPLANDAGIQALTGPRDMALAKKLVADSGYKGERVVLMAPTDFPVVNAIAQVTREVYVKVGLNVDFVTADWGTVVSRRASKESVEKGGWSTFTTYGDGLAYANPGSHTALWGNGLAGWFGWPTSPRIETLRAAWYDAGSLDQQKQIARQLQTLAFEEAPYIPVGQWFNPTAHRSNLTGIVKSSTPIFWNVQRS